MNVNDDAYCLSGRVVLAFIASKLAPTGEMARLTHSPKNPRVADASLLLPRTDRKPRHE